MKRAAALRPALNEPIISLRPRSPYVYTDYGLRTPSVTCFSKRQSDSAVVLAKFFSFLVCCSIASLSKLPMETVK